MTKFRAENFDHTYSNSILFYQNIELFIYSSSHFISQIIQIFVF